jgi:transcription-repair coupling factor (superfamily II helicase)
MTQAKRFHDIFESLDETNAENIRKQYNTIVLPLYQGFIDEENQITCGSPDFLNAIINIKQLFEKQNITLKN